VPYIANAVTIVGNTFLVKSSTNDLLAQYLIADGSLMDVQGMANPYSYMKRVGENQAYVFSIGSGGYLYNISATLICQGICNCPAGYIELNQ